MDKNQFKKLTNLYVQLSTYELLILTHAFSDERFAKLRDYLSSLPDDDKEEIEKTVAEMNKILDEIGDGEEAEKYYIDLKKKYKNVNLDEKYWYSKYLDKILQYIEDKKADTLEEAIILFEKNNQSDINKS